MKPTPTAPPTVSATTKLPRELAEQATALAGRRKVSLSALLRLSLERELRTEGPGPIELATRARVGDLASSTATAPRALAAIELARRLDVDPASGPQHSRELDRLLGELDRTTEVAAPDELDYVQARVLLRRAGWTLRSPEGECSCVRGGGSPARPCPNGCALPTGPGVGVL